MCRGRRFRRGQGLRQLTLGCAASLAESSEPHNFCKRFWQYQPRTLRKPETAQHVVQIAACADLGLRPQQAQQWPGLQDTTERTRTYDLCAARSKKTAFPKKRLCLIVSTASFVNTGVDDTMSAKLKTIKH